MRPDVCSTSDLFLASQGPTWLSLDLCHHRQLYRLTPDCRGGVILQKRFYTELICPGSALGGTIDTAVTGIFAFGSIKLDVPKTPIERQQAYQLRLNQSNSLQKLMKQKSESKRIYLLFEKLIALVGLEESLAIPAELMSQLIGLAPKAITLMRLRFAQEKNLTLNKIDFARV